MNFSVLTVFLALFLTNLASSAFLPASFSRALVPTAAFPDTASNLTTITGTPYCVQNPNSAHMCSMTYSTISSTLTSNITLFNPRCYAVATPEIFAGLKSDILAGYLTIPSYLEIEFGFHINATILPTGVYSAESFLFHYGDYYGNATVVEDSPFPEFWVSETTKITGGLSFFHRIPFRC